MVLQVYYLKNKLLSMTFENDLSEFAKNISRGKSISCNVIGGS